jgi:uncharacterized protein
MKFKVKDIGNDGIDVDMPITPAWLAQQCAELELRPDPTLAFHGRIEVTGEDYLLRGKLAGHVLLPCARCLEDARLAIDEDISVVYVEQEGDSPDESDDEATDAPDVLTFSDGTIDLTPELRDELLMAVPVRVVCREDCAGLCAVCGGNRNLNPCECVDKQRQSASAFAALAKLKS